jgi:hypothetical protein
VRNSLDTIAREWRRVEELVPKSEGGKLAGSVAGASGSAAVVSQSDPDPFDQVHPELEVDGRSISRTNDSGGYRPFFGPVLRSGTHSYRFRLAQLFSTSKENSSHELWGVCAEESVQQAMRSDSCYELMHGFGNGKQKWIMGSYSTAGRLHQVGDVVDMTIDCDQKKLSVAVIDNGGSMHGPWEIPDIPVPCRFMGVLSFSSSRFEFVD